MAIAAGVRFDEMIVPPDDLPHVRPLSAKVEALAGFGIPANEIACVLDVQEADLVRDYAKELAGGAIKANARVAESLFRKAIGEGRESVTAAIFWLKTRARWRETSGPEGSSQPVIVQIQRFAADL